MSVKFTINTKELKTLIEKVSTVINKKSVVSSLRRLYFAVTDNSISLLGTDMEKYIEVVSKDAYNTTPGTFGMDIEDSKVISKMSGNITLEYVSDDKNKVINLRCGKKILTMQGYDNVDDIKTPNMENEENIMLCNENWLFDTLTNLAIFTSNDETKPAMQYFNFNTKKKRIEALDGYRIGIRKIENQTIYAEYERTTLLHNSFVNVMKKLIDKKQENDVLVSQDVKYIKVSGKNYTYIERNAKQEYFRIDQMLDMERGFSFDVNRKDFLDVMKYNTSLINKHDMKPVILHSFNGNLYSYICTCNYKSFDELETKNNSTPGNMYIGFNPFYLLDAFNVIDSDEPHIVGLNNKAPFIITGNEYTVLTLSVSFGNTISNEECERIFDEYMKKVA